MKTVWIIAVLATFLYGTDGRSVYQKHCMQCHVEVMEKKEVIKHLNTLKAPPMIEVSNRLKDNVVIGDEDIDVKRRVIIAFVKDYIENPSIQYSMCNPMAIEKFGVMPSLKGKLSDEERQAVAEWVYDRYEGVTFR